MKRLLVLVLVLVIVIGALGYWRGWFGVTKEEGSVAVQTDAAKFKQDKEALGKTIGAKTKALKDKVAGLWKKTEGLTGDHKVDVEKELAELEKKHERLEKQLKELDEADPGKFESIREDLSKSLDEVEKKIEELTKKLEKPKDK